MALTDSIKEYFKETGSLNKKRFRHFILAAPFWILIIAIGLMSAGIIRYNLIKGYTADQKTAAIWQQSGSTEFRHVSVFARGSRSLGAGTPSMYVDKDISLNRNDIISIRTSLQNIADSALPSGKKGGLNDDGSPRGWEDCFSTFIQLPVTYQTEGMTAPRDVDVDVIAVEGNYKVFHPFKYMSGGFLPEIGVDSNQIVINDVLAWKLFSSYDVTGRMLKINGINFTIVGVVAENTDGISRATGSDQPRAYIYFKTLENMVLQPDENGISGQLAILSYEAMLPEMVRGVARSDISNALPNYSGADPKLFVVSNTDRYSLLSVWDFMTPLGESETRLEGYEFPYWENTAQQVTLHLFADMIMTAAGAVLLLIGGVACVLRWKNFKPEDEKDGTDSSEEEAVVTA